MALTGHNAKNYKLLLTSWLCQYLKLNSTVHSHYTGSSSNLYSITSRLNIRLFSAVTARPVLFEIDNRPMLYYLLRPMHKNPLLQHRTRPDPTRGSTRPVEFCTTAKSYCFIMVHKRHIR